MRRGGKGGAEELGAEYTDNADGFHCSDNAPRPKELGNLCVFS